MNSLREAYPQQYYKSEIVPSYESYDLGGAQGVEEEPEIVLPEEDEVFPRYNSEYIFSIKRRYYVVSNIWPEMIYF